VEDEIGEVGGMEMWREGREEREERRRGAFFVGSTHSTVHS